MSTVRVRPRTGIILAGVPATGADIDSALAAEWLANGLVTRVDPPKPQPKQPGTPAKER